MKLLTQHVVRASIGQPTKAVRVVGGATCLPIKTGLKWTAGFPQPDCQYIHGVNLSCCSCHASIARRKEIKLHLLVLTLISVYQVSSSRHYLITFFRRSTSAGLQSQLARLEAPVFRWIRFWHEIHHDCFPSL